MGCADTVAVCRAFGRQGLPLCGITTAIVAEPQEDALLPQPGDLGDVKVVELNVGKYCLWIYCASSSTSGRSNTKNMW